jgi:tetratricopeptide (TPR) repeat protein
LSLNIDREALEKACKQIIETILLCLPNAFKGTVFLIGSSPDLIAQRVTSGIFDSKRQSIFWGLPEKSEYNPPGKPWNAYRDEPGRPLEAMAWCVERQISWTAEDPKNDIRSLRLQMESEFEHFHHMEPVLIRKNDLFPEGDSSIESARTFNGEIVWKHSEFMVVAVITIHFKPNTIKINSPETGVIKVLSRALGTELLSYQLREQSLEAIRQLAEDKLNSYNILSDSLRNTITKSGLIFSLIKQEMGFLREQWEGILLHSDQRGMKRDAIKKLNSALKNIASLSDILGDDLLDIHDRFLGLSLPPEKGEKWICMQIEGRWNELLCNIALEEKQIKEIQLAIDQLKKSLYLGKDPKILASYEDMPDSLKKEWIELVYSDMDSIDFDHIDKLIEILENPLLHLPYQEKSRKSLKNLKTLAEIMDDLEKNTNMVLRKVLNGSDKRDDHKEKNLKVV